MTKILILKRNSMILGFKVKGHSGFAKAGSDIVCSAVSVACEMTLAGLKDVLKLGVDAIIDDGFMQVLIDENSAKIESAQTLLKTFELTAEKLAENYASNVKLEVKEDVF